VMAGWDRAVAGFGWSEPHVELPMLAPPHEFFVLGDNRPISCDSREFGLVAEHLLKGRVRMRFWPLATASVL
jgi:signal peptidase I